MYQKMKGRKEDGGTKKEKKKMKTKREFHTNTAVED